MVTKNLVSINIRSEDDTVSVVKKNLKNAIYPDDIVPFSTGFMAQGLLEIYFYKKHGGTTSGFVDLMIFYVECGIELSIKYGDIDEDFYFVLLDILKEALSFISMDDSLLKAYSCRLHAIIKRLQDNETGYGFEDLVHVAIDKAFPGNPRFCER